MTRSNRMNFRLLRARLASKSRAKTTNSECRSLLDSLLVSCTVAILDLLRLFAAKSQF